MTRTSLWTTYVCVSSDPVIELLDEIQKLFKAFMEDEKRVKDATKAVEDSMDTRQQAKQKLGQCVKGDLEPLEKEIQELSVGNLNRQVSINQRGR